jgi:hypothetical protein
MKTKSKLHALEGICNGDIAGGLSVVVGRGNPSDAFILKGGKSGILTIHEKNRLAERPEVRRFLKRHTKACRKFITIHGIGTYG